MRLCKRFGVNDEADTAAVVACGGDVCDVCEACDMFDERDGNNSLRARNNSFICFCCCS